MNATQEKQAIVTRLNQDGVPYEQQKQLRAKLKQLDDLVSSNGNEPATNGVQPATVDKQPPEPDIETVTTDIVSSVPSETVKQWNSETPKTSFSADELLDTDFPQPPMLVPDIIAIGLNNLAGRPKIGKSYLALQMAGAAGTGGQVLGRKVEQVPVLYLALEDNPARLKKRMQEQKWQKGANVRFELKWPLLDKGGLEKLDGEIKDFGYRFIVIDTLSRATFFNQDRVEQATLAMSGLQSLSFSHGAAILGIDHHKKLYFNSAQDVIDDVLGSTGKTAVPDSIIGLYKRQGEKRAELKVVGRDQEFIDLTLEMAYDTMTWQLVGETQNVVSRDRHEGILLAISELCEDATHANIQKFTEIPKATLTRDLNKLIDEGILFRIGEGIGAYYQQKAGTILF